MTLDDANAVLDYLKRSSEQHAVSLRRAMESQLDQGDRAIAQIAQLKIMNEHGSPVDIIAALQGVAAGENPL